MTKVDELVEWVARLKLCNDYGMTEDAMRLCIEQDKIRAHHIKDAYNFASKLLSYPDLALIFRVVEGENTNAELDRFDEYQQEFVIPLAEALKK